ncbi:hypothetical protein ACIPUC_31620 [Streptomyces sp. LARHCF249]
MPRTCDCRLAHGNLRGTRALLDSAHIRRIVLYGVADLPGQEYPPPGHEYPRP